MSDAWKEAASAAMERYSRGDGAAFATLYDLLAPRISSFLLRRTRDKARTEDILQQTFLQMHQARHHFSVGAEVAPWAYAIARRLLIDAFRKGAREWPVEEDAEDVGERASPELAPDAVVGRQRLARRLDEELSRLPETHRAAFDLVQREGLTMAETAQVLGTTVAAVKLRAFRTYEALRAAMGDAVREELGEPQ